jgi:FkbM family methyltransferase
VLRGPARGLKIVVEPGLGVTYVLGTKAAAPRCFGDTIGRGMTVIDVGANKGQMTLVFAALVGKSGRVIALEPAPREFDSLVRNVRLNGLTQVETLRAAAADVDAPMAFLYLPDRPTQGKLVGVEASYCVLSAHEIAVPGIRLDALLARGVAPDLIKLDVEGAAAVVLRGARRIINTYAPRIYVELHGPEEQAGIRDELLARGYVAHTLDGREVKDPTARWFSPLWCHKPSRRPPSRNVSRT